MRILVLGGGGREHAIVHALAASPQVEAIFAAPGNGGTAGERATVNISLDAENPAAVAEYATANAIDLVVIGPEAPLVVGVADAVREAGVPVFGPGASGARVEGSKRFSKELMARHSIPTGAAASFTDRDAALAYLAEVGAPIVVKADGLAAGKGVTVAEDVETARAAIEECFDGRFGDAGATVVIEEYLVGQECSILAFVDGRTVLPMAPAQDHKRAFDGDTGPNTGGMGVYSPVPKVDLDTHERMVRIMQDSADALADEGIEYRGVLYGGFILTAEGPKLLEFNARFGDPETQVVLPRLKTDLATILLACAKGELAGKRLEWNTDVAVSVVIASGGYPDAYETGKVIDGLEAASALPGVSVYHAGTKVAEDGSVLSAGGRVLNVTACAADFETAIARAYEAVALISFEGSFHRTDIAKRALEASRG